MRINTQRQKYAHFPARAIISAFFAGIVCGLFLAAWWRLAQINQNKVFVERELISNPITERN